MKKKIKGSLGAKLFLFLVALLIGISLCILLVVNVAVLNNYKEVSNNRFGENSNELYERLSKYNYEDAKEIITDFCIQNNAVAQLSVEDDELKFGNLDSSDRDAVGTSYAYDIKFKDSDNRYALYVMALNVGESDLETAMKNLTPIVIGGIILISLLAAYVYTRTMVKPIKNVSGIAQKMSELDFSQSIQSNRSDEIGILANSLDIMSTKLDTALNELEIANKNLKQDMNVMSTMNEQRKDFFTAVSHELKTPITILKGQVESMIMGIGDYTNHEKYLPQIMHEIENVEYLVQELLMISKLKTIGVGTIEKKSIKELISQSVQEYQPLIDEKELQLELNEQDFTIDVNTNLFNKVLHNLLGNAVRYSPKKEIITIASYQKNNQKVLSIKNTGISIPKDSLSSLFEPFYRIDQSRNKNLGGSGLGLYIVKVILELQEMQYKIQSDENSVKFTIILEPNSQK